MDQLNQLYLIGPEIILTVFAMIVLTVDLLSDARGRTWSPWLTLLGMLLALADAVALYYGPATTVLGTMYAADVFTSFFRIITLVLAILIVLLSKDYIEKRSKFIAEFYG